MRAVMRETYFLLGVAGIESVFSGSVPSALPALTYEELSQLRPGVSPTSWRGMAAKLVEEKRVVKTLKGGKTALQLTRLGLDTFTSLFSILEPFGSGGEWQLCILQVQNKVRASQLEAKRMLLRNGYFMIHSLLFVRFQDDYSGILAKDLEKLGFLVAFVPFDQEKVRPMELHHLLDQGFSENFALQRRIKDLSNQSYSLLSSIEKNKALSKNKKQSIGSMMVSGLSLLSELPPGWYLKRERVELSLSLAKSLQKLFASLPISQ